jgi:hypothetical protein
LQILILTPASLATDAFSNENLVDEFITKKGEGLIAAECSSEFKQVVELIPKNALGFLDFGISSWIRHGEGKHEVGESESKEDEGGR